MPLLTKQEAFDFVRDLLGHFRPSEPPSQWFPFTQNLVAAIIDRVTKNNEVTPRVLMKAFDAILTEADFQIGIKEVFKLDVEGAIQIVERCLRELAEEDEKVS
jgi:hypothetical protein